ncbi:MAG: hypothetical protein ACRC4O_03455 [Giesbergeria sp.]
MEVRNSKGEIRGVNAYGQRVAVPDAHLDDFLAGGGRVATAEDLAAYQKEQKEEALKAKAEAAWTNQSLAGKVGTVASLANPIAHVVARAYGGVLPPEVEAYISGVDSTMTGNLAGGLLRKSTEAASAVLPGADPQAAEKYHDVREGASLSSPVARGLGMAAGVGGVIASSGSSLTSQIGERTAARIGGAIAADSAGSRIASSIASTAGRFGVEGAIMGAQHQVGDNLLEDRDIGDKVFAAAGLGGALGLVSGGVLGAGGGLFSEGFRASKDIIGGRFRQAVAKALASEGAASEEIAAEQLLSSNATRFAERSRDEFALRALQGTPAGMKKAAKGVAGGEGAIGKYVAEDIIGPTVAGVTDKVEVARRAASIGTPERLLEALEADKKARILPMFEEAFKPIETKTTATDDLRRMLADHVDAMKRDPRTVLGARATLDKVTQHIDALEARAGGVTDVSTKELYFDASRLRGDYQSTAHVAEKQGIKGFWDKVDKQIVSDISAGGKAKEIAEAKRLYQLNVRASQLAEQGVQRGLGNNMLSLRSSFAANTGAMIGAGIGASVLGPVGGLAGAGLGHVAAGTGWQYASNRGHAVAAALMHKAAIDGTIRRGVRLVEGLTEEGAKALVQGGRIAVPVPTKRLPERAMESLGKATRWSATLGTVDAVNKQTEALRKFDPALADTVVNRVAQSASQLRDAKPQPDPRPFPPPEPRRLTDQDQSRLARLTEYHEAPLRALRDVAAGRWNKEALQVLETTAPGVLNELRYRTIRRLEMTKREGKAPSYDHQRKVGEALGVPVVAEQRPEHAAFLQSLAVSPQEPQGMKKNPVGRPRKLDPSNTSTFLDRNSVLGRQRR